MSTSRKRVSGGRVARKSGVPRSAEVVAAAADDASHGPDVAASAPPKAPRAIGRLTGAEARKAIRDAQAIVPMIITGIEMWRTEQLVLLDRNPRTHSDQQVAEIAASMREFGFLWPIIVNGETRQIVAGNGRYLAAVRLGLPLVPVIEERHLTAVQRRAFIIADNKIALNAGWADEILAGEFPALEAAGFDLSLTGFDDDEIEDILASVAADEGAPEEPPLPPVPVEPVTRRGDLWLLGHHRVLCGDATNLADLERVLDGAHAEAVWTDPPYNVAYEGGAGTIQNDAMSEEAFAEFLRKAFGALVKVMHPGASIYVAHADTNGFTFRRCFIEAGFKLASCLIWRKNALVLSRGDYHWQHEPILYGWRPGAAHRWFGARDKTTILEFNAEFGAPPFRQVGDDEWQIALGETTLIVRGRDLTVQPVRGTMFFEDKPKSNSEHPTMKPVPLIRRMLANSARRGDRVLDPFGGSGSTLIACESLGLRGHLVELDERFVDVIVARWENLTGGKAKREPAGSSCEVPAAAQGCGR